jgi:hypothetical protein
MLNDKFYDAYQFPNLQALILEFHSFPLRPVLSALFIQKMPVLKHLGLTGITDLSCLPAKIPSLTSLSIQTDSDKDVRTIRLDCWLPQLTELLFLHSRLIWEESQVLPLLKKLTLTCTQINDVVPSHWTRWMPNVEAVDGINGEIGFKEATLVDLLSWPHWNKFSINISSAGVKL